MFSVGLETGLDFKTNPFSLRFEKIGHLKRRRWRRKAGSKSQFYQNWRLFTNAALTPSPIGQWCYFGSTSQHFPATGSINRKPSSCGHLVKLHVIAAFWLVGFNVIIRRFVQSPFKAGSTFIVQVTQFFFLPQRSDLYQERGRSAWIQILSDQNHVSWFSSVRKKKITYNFNICDCICSPSGPIGYSLALRLMHRAHFNISSLISSLLKIPFRKKKKHQLSSSQSPRECCVRWTHWRSLTNSLI